MSFTPEGLTKDLIVAFPLPCGRNAQRDNLKSIMSSRHENIILRFKSYLKVVQHAPVKIAQPAAAASEILWPDKPGRNEPPITAIGVKVYKCLNSPAKEGG